MQDHVNVPLNCSTLSFLCYGLNFLTKVACVYISYFTCGRLFGLISWHQYLILHILLKKKVECIRIDDSTPAGSRQALLTDFQEKDSVKAAVLSIKAGGLGLTLTAASTVIFAELSWTPGDIILAEDRAQ
ncbi:chromatin remodeling factor18 [Perilla frutescens var. hirtella]|uniref:Chromatin remodeling factor18 n=1 Tax=Perilla frutescens var. hirtella TaxID=608512 RepID=A0AAD4JJB7_PERFH|nr:chromatin remodeling factor18 [Perilla frutescens var. hirtella]